MTLYELMFESGIQSVTADFIRIEVKADTPSFICLELFLCRKQKVGDCFNTLAL